MGWSDLGNQLLTRTFTQNYRKWSKTAGGGAKTAEGQ